MNIDVRHVLPMITCPTLILHAARDRNVPVEAARSCRDLIDGAELVELDSDIHMIWLSDVIDELTAHIERFVEQRVPSLGDFHRALATVLAVETKHRGSWPDEAFRPTVERWRGRPTYTPGMATFDGPARAVRCAQALLARSATHGQATGVAIHTGECVLAGSDVQGAAVDIARELASHARSGEVLVSQTVRDLLVGSGIALERRDSRRFTGIQGVWEVFSVSPVGA
jgi:class 3 adenylate cyclase